MKLLLPTVFLFPVVAFADDPFSCVDPRLRAAFMHSGIGETVYSTEVPANFVPHATPPGATLVGSQVFGSTASTVMYELDDASDAMEAMVAGLQQDGWKSLDESEGRGRGFQSSMMGNFSRFCQEDGEGILTLMTRNTADHTFLSMSVSSGGGQRTCDDVSAQMTMRRYNPMSLAKEVPNLDLPRGTVAHGSGSAGGQDEWETHTLVETDMDRASLLSVLSDQIRDQGWTFDTRWSGSLSSGSAWSKTSEEGELLIGTLHAYAGTDDKVNLRFTILMDREARSRAQIATF